MRRSFLFFLIVSVAVGAYLFLRPPVPVWPHLQAVKPVPMEVSPESQQAKPAVCGHVGEMITYIVKTAKMASGRAVFHHRDTIERDGRLMHVVSFETKMPKFNDRELIHSDAFTFLPLKVERAIANWPLSETITEVYEQEKGRVTVSKTRSGKTQTIVIQKTGTLHNAILLPYFVRCLPSLEPGWSMRVQLPTQDFTITLAGIETVKVSAGTFRAFHFTSIPKRIEIWITADERKIPVKVRNTGFLGYSLEMREYQP